MSAKKIIFLVILSLLLSACGYHLRGAGGSSAVALQSLYLENGSERLREQFRKTLGIASGQWAKTPKDAAVIVNIINESSGQHILSLSSGGRSNELELYYSLEYEVLKADNTILVPHQAMQVKREYFNNQQEILAKANEEAVIRGEMYQEAVLAIIDRTRIILAARKN
jgi:LPS-assembly lipoprotein